MSSNSDLLLSSVTIIKQFYFSAGFVGEECFESICSKLEKSNGFKAFKWPEKYVFSTYFREGEETFRTFEMKEGVEVVNLGLITTKLSGQLRILIMICRAGFVVLSIIHSIIPERKRGEPKGKNLTSAAPLTSIDVNYLLEEEKTAIHPVRLTYEVNLDKTAVEMSSSDILEYLLKNLEDHGLMIKKMPRKTTRTICCWDFNLSSKTLRDLIEENYKDLFIMFATPKDSLLPRRSKQSILEGLKSSLHSSSKNRGFFFDSISMLIISPRKTRPGNILLSQLLWIFQLVSLEDFLLKFYSAEVRRISSKLVSATADQYPSFLEYIVKLREGFSLALEDLYWVENDLFRLQSATLVAEYKRNFKLEEKLNVLQKRFTLIQDRCKEALTALEHRFLEKREESITNLTLIFATFGLGEILSAFIIWYFGYILMNEPAPTSYLILGLAVTFLVISAIFLIARLYINKTSRRPLIKNIERADLHDDAAGEVWTWLRLSLATK